MIVKEKIHGTSEDFEFIAAARADLPRCIAALDEAETLLQQAQAALADVTLAERISRFFGAPGH